MISIYCAHSLFSLCCRVLKHSGTALKEETGDREGIWQHVGLSPQSQIPVCFVLWEAFNPTLQKRNALDSVGARAHPAGLGFRSAIESSVMDLTCPSLLMDNLKLEETSDYGSRETSDSEPSIGGLCQLLHREGIWCSFSSNLDFNNLLTYILFYRNNRLLQRKAPVAPEQRELRK